MKTQQQTAVWMRELRTIAEKVKAEKISPIIAAGNVRGAYETFLKSTYTAPRRWEDEANKVWQGRPNLNSPAGELAWWARSVQARAGRSRRKAFFDSEALWETINAITEAQVNKLRRLYGPPAWRWEP